MFELAEEFLVKLYELGLVVAEFGVGFAVFAGISFAVVGAFMGIANYTVGAATSLAKKLGIKKEK